MHDSIFFNPVPSTNPGSIPANSSSAKRSRIQCEEDEAENPPIKGTKLICGQIFPGGNNSNAHPVMTGGQETAADSNLKATGHATTGGNADSTGTVGSDPMANNNNVNQASNSLGDSPAHNGSNANVSTTGENSFTNANQGTTGEDDAISVQETTNDYSRMTNNNNVNQASNSLGDSPARNRSNDNTSTANQDSSTNASHSTADTPLVRFVTDNQMSFEERAEAMRTIVYLIRHDGSNIASILGEGRRMFSTMKDIATLLSSLPDSTLQLFAVLSEEGNEEVRQAVVASLHKQAEPVLVERIKSTRDDKDGAMDAIRVSEILLKYGVFHADSMCALLDVLLPLALPQSPDIVRRLVHSCLSKLLDKDQS